MRRKFQYSLFPLPPKVNKRKWEIAKFVADGLSNKQIAWELHLAEGSIKHYMYCIFKDVGCSNRAQLAVWYIKNAKSNLD